MSSDVARWPDDFPAVAGYRRCSHTVRPGVSIAGQFARPGLNRFGSARWRPGMTRSPVLRGVHALLECLTHQVFAAGDHDIVLGRVIAAHSADAGKPLMYYAGRYHRM